MIRFEFTEALRARAVQEAFRRQESNLQRGLLGRNRAPSRGDDALMYHMLGAAGELAVASYLGWDEWVYEDQEPQRGSADLPCRIDVKTRSKHTYDLLIQLDDQEDKRLVLVTIENLETRLHGWLYGHEARKLGTVRELVPGRPAYVVPRSKLRPLSTLADDLADCGCEP